MKFLKSQEAAKSLLGSKRSSEKSQWSGYPPASRSTNSKRSQPKMWEFKISRRSFASLTFTGAFAGLLSSRRAFPASAPLTARQIVDRIKEHLGIPWNNKTYRDIFHAGDPEIGRA